MASLVFADIDIMILNSIKASVFWAKIMLKLKKCQRYSDSNCINLQDKTNTCMI